MKAILALCMLLLPGVMLLAQETTTDTVAVEEEYQYIEDGEDSEEDYTVESEPEVSHTVVAPETMPATQEHARRKMTVRKFDNEQWKKVVGETNYEEKPDEPRKDKEKKKEAEDNTDVDLSVPWDNEFLRVIAYVLVIALILFIVYYFVKDIRLSDKIRPTGLPINDLSAPVENIEHIDVTSQLQKTLAEGNFKLAVRMYFLDLLKKLNETGRIVWKKDKTNRDYLGEVYAKAFYFDEVRKLTLAYEQVWYGDHALPHESYQRLFSDFESMVQKINASPAA